MPRWPEKKSHKNRHSCYILKYHLILVTKYRNPVITGIVKEDLIDLSRYYWKPLFWSDSSQQPCNLLSSRIIFEPHCSHGR